MITKPIAATTLLRDIVREHPSAMKTLDAYHLDWCCGARRTLGEACVLAHTPLDQVLRELAREEPSPADAFDPIALEHLSMKDLVTRIVEQHHAYTRSVAPRLRTLSTRVAARHGREHPELSGVEELVTGLLDELEPHMVREERILFPAMVALEEGTGGSAPFASFDAPIGVMTRDHEEAGRILDDLARTTGHFTAPSTACESWVALCSLLREHDANLRRHVWIENEILFPRALELEQRVSPRTTGSTS